MFKSLRNPWDITIIASLAVLVCVLVGVQLAGFELSFLSATLVRDGIVFLAVVFVVRHL